MYPQRLLRRRYTTPPFSDVDGDDTERLLRSLEPRVVATPPAPAPVVEQPVLARRFPVPDVVTDLGSPPLTRIDRRQHPQILSGFENELEAQRQYRSEVAAYQPRDRTGWKDFGLSALRDFVRGGLPGVALGAAHRVVEPDFEDKIWQQQQLGRTNAQIDQLMQEQRVGLQDELLRSQVEENRAQAEKARNPTLVRPSYSYRVEPDGTKVRTMLNPETKTFEPVLNDAGQPEILARPAPKVRVSTPAGDLEVTSGEALGYYGQMANLDRQSATASRSVAEAEAAERDALDKRRQASETLASLRTQLAQLQPATAPDSSGRINDPNYWAERDKLEALIKDAESEVSYRQRLADDAAKEARESRAKGGDPRVKAYADQFFGGDVQKAMEAIRKQRGQ